MADFDFFVDTAKVKTGRCDGCKYCKAVYANGGWSFLGCYCKPYRGKWVSEIKDCPLKERESK